MKLEHRLSALPQLHLHSQLNTWLQWIGQRQLQDETTNSYILELGAPYIRELTANLRVSRLIVQLSLPNPMKSYVKSRMKM